MVKPLKSTRVCCESHHSRRSQGIKNEGQRSRWSKCVEWPAKRCYGGLVAAGVQEQAEDILVPPLLLNCLTLNYISFS